MNTTRRGFLSRLASGLFGFSILPQATTYSRTWKEVVFEARKFCLTVPGDDGDGFLITSFHALDARPIETSFGDVQKLVTAPGPRFSCSIAAHIAGKSKPVLAVHGSNAAGDDVIYFHPPVFAPSGSKLEASAPCYLDGYEMKAVSEKRHWFRKALVLS